MGNLATNLDLPRHLQPPIVVSYDCEFHARLRTSATLMLPRPYCERMKYARPLTLAREESACAAPMEQGRRRRGVRQRLALARRRVGFVLVTGDGIGPRCDDSDAAPVDAAVKRSCGKSATWQWTGTDPTRRVRDRVRVRVPSQQSTSAGERVRFRCR